MPDPAARPPLTVAELARLRRARPVRSSHPDPAAAARQWLADQAPPTATPATPAVPPAGLDEALVAAGDTEPYL